MSTIDVIVPVYRVEQYIDRCVKSILNQTFQDFCLVLVDDGSDDNCPKICDEYAQSDKRIHVIHQKNQGLSAARNAGIEWSAEHTDSEWITFVDSDDWVHCRYCEYLLKAAKEHSTEIAVCKLKKVSEFVEDESISVLNDYKITSKKYYLEHYDNSVPSCGKLYKKQLFSNIKFPTGRLHEDEFTTYKLLFSQNEITVLPQNLYYYFFNSTGITQSVWTPKRIDGLIAIEERLAFFAEINDEELYEKTAVIYLAYIHMMLKKINRIEDHKVAGDYIALLRKHIRTMIKNNTKINVEKYPGIYEFAYPKEMKIYWYKKAIQKRINKGMLFRQ